MQTDTFSLGNGQPPAGLPPVTPPSGRHILQLFLVPGIIVAVFVLAYLGWKKLTHRWYTPQAFLKRLDNADPDVRWRAADDLAQVLLRDDQLASDVPFALALCGHLRQAITANASTETAYSRRTDPASAGDLKTLEAGRDYVEYLSACVGNLSIPVGIPLLAELSTMAQGADPAALAHRRRRAVWALANLGENLKRFDRLSPERKAEVLAALDSQGGGDEEGEAARVALQCLSGRQAGTPNAPEVDEALARCAADDDAFLRQITAIALGSWEGNPTQNARMEKALVRLAGDDGRSSDGNTERWRWEIRAQAAVALARRGSDKISAGTLANLLDHDQQLTRFRRQLPDGRDVADEAVAEAAVASTIKAVAELHRRDPSRDLSSLRRALERLAQSSNLTLKTEARRTLAALGGT